MQEKKSRTANAERTASMRARLISAARGLFVEKGYADTSTPEVVRAAGVTRGALYHHFADKLALFDAVVEAEAAIVTREVNDAADIGDDPLRSGSIAFFDAMRVQGRARLLLLDGPALLGHDRMDAINAAQGRASLRDGLAEARNDLAGEHLDALAVVLSAAFDRAALDIANGAAVEPYLEVLLALMSRAADR